MNSSLSKLIDLIDDCFKNNPNKHIDNGNTYYINCEGYGHIKLSNGKYFISTGIFDIKYHPINIIKQNKIYQLINIIKKK